VRRTTSRLAPPGADYQIQIVGDRPRLARDFYHALLRLPWWVTIAAISGTFLLVNALFAVGFALTDGVAHARHGSFADAFFFSVQTMGTIGYGALYPDSLAANVLVVAESIASLTLTALCTGLVFAKFSRSTARLVFTRTAVICPHAGAPALMFRIGNQRGNQIVDARIRVVMVRTERLPDGGTFYRMLDLNLQRSHALSLSRSWSVIHPIDPQSPLHGQTPESLTADEVELQVLVVGLDDILMQTVHAQHRYTTKQIIWGARHADVLTETAEGNLILDLRNFDVLEPTRPIAGFPYRADPDAPPAPGNSPQE
jgi:inward rectifier potassium channel